jgi:hypothetical protein
MLEALGGQTGVLYESNGKVLDRNLVGTAVAGSYALVSAGEYKTLEELKASGYAYYTEERTHAKDSSRKHTIAYAPGTVFDPYVKDIGNNWWNHEDTYTSNRYIGYKTHGGKR